MIRHAFEFGPLAVWALMLLTVVRPLRLGRTARAALALALLLASQKFLVYRIFGGDSFVPDLPERFVNFTGWAYSAAMLLFGLSCAWALLRALCPPLRRPAASRLALPALAALAAAVAG